MPMTKKAPVVTEAQARAKAMGHSVVSDPPFFSAAERWTCQWCCRSVIRYGNNVYGSAIEKRCTEEGRL